MKEKIRVGLATQLKLESGGAYGYERAVLKQLESITHTSRGTPVSFLPIEIPPNQNRDMGTSSRRFLAAARNLAQNKLGNGSSRQSDSIRQSEIDFLYFLTPNWSIERVLDLPVVSTVWDLGHRDLPEFPEFRGREWLARERMFREHLPRCFHIFTDSDFTGVRLSKIYGVDDARWSSLPFSALDGNSKVSIELAARRLVIGPFIYYPARFWPHKNHHVLLQALDRLTTSWPELRLVLTGARSDNYGLTEMIKASSVSDRVIDLGFVSDSTVDELTRSALAVVMPSLLGPTNLPPVQAVQFSTPALVSDAHHFDEGVAKHLTIIPSHDPSAWAKEILALKERRTSRNNGFTGTSFEEVFLPVLDRFERSRSLWP